MNIVIASWPRRGSGFCLLSHAPFVFLLVCAFAFKAYAQPCPYAWEPIQRLSETSTANFSSWLATVGDTVHAMVHGGSFDPRLYYRRSTDEGRNWMAQAIIVGDSLNIQMSKRPFAASRSHVYAVWENINASGATTSIKLGRSTNGGAAWSENQVIITPPLISATPMVAASDSMTYVTIIRSVAGIWQYFMARSENAGQTWTSPRQITVLGESHSNLGDICATRRAVHIAFERGTPPSGREISYINSVDSGRTWSSEQVLSTVDNYQAWEPQLAADNQGNVYVCWQDAKYGSVGGFAGTLLMRHSTDNGFTWLLEQRISSIASAERSTLTAASNNVYTAWADLRLGNLNPRVYSRGSSDFGMSWCDEELVGNPNFTAGDMNLAGLGSYVHLSMGISTDSLPTKIYYTRRGIVTGIQQAENLRSLQARLFSPFPNPFNSETTIAFELPHSGEVRLSVHDILGREISVLTTGIHERGIYQFTYGTHDIASGIYYVSMQVGGRKEVRPILLLW